MELLSPEQQSWVIRPLVDAGLGMDQICNLVFRVGFEAIVTEGHGTVVAFEDLTRDQPAEVRAAWAAMIGRMIALHAPSDELDERPHR